MTAFAPAGCSKIMGEANSVVSTKIVRTKAVGCADGSHTGRRPRRMVGVGHGLFVEDDTADAYHGRAYL